MTARFLPFSTFTGDRVVQCVHLDNMRGFFIIAVLGAASASAHVVERGLLDFPGLTTICGLSQFPTCALPCLLKAPRGKCGVIDFHCLCHNNKYIEASSECVLDSCNDEDTLKAIDAQEATCKGQ